ncbi:hypothetical protein KDX16_14215 [Burkholderia vietnamiensis]|uniref:hypothetical protein n=1 Tax=Burkholderia vietnamiensis TaxID=60552 RepID=UPI000753429D|nr:hypothetical protein [Burkholderia vietnamiensis]KVE92382.1 hypothetical protein WJ01_23850 [Burkholderia vietnamiensis]MBR7916987.1 hypothetical protein [Burkholderia vietnamiensis]
MADLNAAFIALLGVLVGGYRISSLLNGVLLDSVGLENDPASISDSMRAARASASLRLMKVLVSGGIPDDGRSPEIGSRRVCEWLAPDTSKQKCDKNVPTIRLGERTLNEQLAKC